MVRQKYIDYLIIAILSLITCVAFVHRGMPIGHDVHIELVRVAEYANSLKNSGFPVRWAKDLDGGYGSPIFNFSPPLFLFVASIQILSGFSIITAVKFTLFVFTLTGGIGMYLFAKEFYDNNSSLFCASLYVIAPYHLADIYARNAFSEYTACSIAPFVFLWLIRITRERKICSISIAMLSISGSLFALSHILSIIMYTPLFLIFSLTNLLLNKNRASIFSILISVIITISLTSFYILPLLFEKKFIQIERATTTGWYNISNYFTNFSSLFLSQSFYSLSPLSLLLIILILLSMVLNRNKIGKVAFINFSLFVGLFLILIFLTTPLSKTIFEYFPSFKIFQFPWRLLSPATLFLCVLAGTITYYTNKKPPHTKRNNFLFITILTTFYILCATSAYLFAERYIQYSYSPDTYFSSSNIRKKNLQATICNEYRPIWVRKENKPSTGNGLSCSDIAVGIKALHVSPTKREYTFLLQKKCVITINLHFFPGWAIYDNDQPINFKITSNGLMEFYLPAGKHNLKIMFKNTTIRLIGNTASIFGLFVLLTLLFLASRNFLYNNNQSNYPE